MLRFAQLATSVKSRYRAADAVTVVAASEQQERTLPGGQGRRSTYDGSIDAPAEAGDEIEGGWRREELLAMDIGRAPQARDSLADRSTIDDADRCPHGHFLTAASIVGNLTHPVTEWWRRG